MAIDRIGKGGALPPTPEPASEVAAPEKAFKVDRAERLEPSANVSATNATNATSATSATNATSPLARLRAGEIDVHGYVDLKVDEATSALKGLSVDQLSEIKSALRDQLRTDPALVDLVRTATGKMPEPPED